MDEVVPKRYLNKYGGVFTSEIRDTRTKKRKRQRKSVEQTAQQPESSNIGNTRTIRNPNESSKNKQNATYAIMFSTYTPPVKKTKPLTQN